VRLVTRRLDWTYAMLLIPILTGLTQTGLPDALPVPYASEGRPLALSGGGVLGTIACASRSRIGNLSDKIIRSLRVKNVDTACRVNHLGGVRACRITDREVRV